MDTRQILKILKQTIDCLGVFPSDKLPKNYRQPSGMVINIDPSKKPGSHWVAVFISAEGNAEYFDSYGLKPAVPAIKKFLQKFKHCQYSKKQVQDYISSVCGQYCIYFLVKRWQNVSMTEILDQFSENLEENDQLVTYWVNDTFDIDTDTYDIEYIVNQICTALKK
jgi:hypothetical protein